jgi:hypothetical protein
MMRPGTTIAGHAIGSPRAPTQRAGAVSRPAQLAAPGRGSDSARAMEYRIEDDFDVSAERYWEVFFSEDYNAALFPALDIDWQLISLDRQGEGKDLVIRRKQRLTPRREVPAIVAKFVKGAITYVEDNVYTAAKSSMTTVTTPNFAADRIDNHGTYRIEALGPAKCRRIWEAVCVCKVPLVGGKVEKILVEEVRESYRRATAFTRDWHARHPA